MESSEVFAALLLWLGKDPPAGARKYEELRLKLIYILRCRGCWEAEDLADETLDRTAKAIAKPGFYYVGEPIAYLRGVAHNVHLEWLRREKRFKQEPLRDDLMQEQNPDHNDFAERMALCLDQCLDLLPNEKRSLLLRYYQGARKAKIDHRLQLADEHGLGSNALRIQVFRLRKQLRKCVESCAAKK